MTTERIPSQIVLAADQNRDRSNNEFSADEEKNKVRILLFFDHARQTKKTITTTTTIINHASKNETK